MAALLLPMFGLLYVGSQWSHDKTRQERFGEGKTERRHTPLLACILIPRVSVLRAKQERSGRQRQTGGVCEKKTC